MSAVFLRERVRIYRWSAVVVGFVGVLVMLAPRLDVGRSAASTAGAIGALLGLMGAFFSAGSTVQTRSLTKSETTSSIVLYFSLMCALAGLCTAPFGWIDPTWPELAALVVIGLFGGLAHILPTESYRHAPASLVAPFDYTSMLGTDSGIFGVRRGAKRVGLSGRRHHRGSRPVRDLARAPAWPTARPRRRGTAARNVISRSVSSMVRCDPSVVIPGRALGAGPESILPAVVMDSGLAASRRPGMTHTHYRPNALNVRMVRVSWMPAIVCTFSLMKWPMSMPGST